MEGRIIAWVSVVVGLVAVYPQARDLLTEYRERQAHLAAQALAMSLPLPEEPLPAGWLRDIYDSTRGPAA